MENSRYIYVFAKYIKGLSEENKKALKSAILSLNDTEFIDRYALYVDKSINILKNMELLKTFICI